MTKVCAHISTESFFGKDHGIFDSVSDAASYFRRYVNEVGNESSVMDVYYSTDCECDSMMNFHDTPDFRYSVGPRGGIRKGRVWCTWCKAASDYQPKDH